MEKKRKEIDGDPSFKDALTKSDIIDILKDIAKIHRDQFDERRRTEWKLVFTVIAFYFAVITTKITNRLEVDKTNSLLLLGIWVIFILIAAIAILYLRAIHLANHKNKSFAKDSENAIRDILTNKKPNLDIFRKAEEKQNIWSNWSWCWQLLLLSSIALGTSFLITIL